MDAAPKVLAIVDDDASAIDARLAEGPITMAKLLPSFETLRRHGRGTHRLRPVPRLDCLNGGLIRVATARG